MSLAGIDWGGLAIRSIPIVILWLTIYLLHRHLARWITRIGERLHLLEFDAKDIRVLRWIIDVVLVLGGLGICLSVFHIAPPALLIAAGPRIVGLAATWIAVWILVRYLSAWIHALDEQIEEIDIDPRDLSTLDRLMDGIVISVGVVVSLAILNITSLLYSALTAAGVVSVVIGFAVKDMAANLISGFFILIDRPFVEGDAIKINEFSGVVTKISLRSTVITTFDGPVVSIPNSTMAVEPTTNYTLSESRRILFTVSVLNSTNLGQAVDVIRRVLQAESRLLPDQGSSILVDQIRDYAVDIQVIAYTTSADYFDTQSDLQGAVVSAFAEQGIELAVPIRMNLGPLNPMETHAGGN